MHLKMSSENCRNIVKTQYVDSTDNTDILSTMHATTSQVSSPCCSFRASAFLNVWLFKYKMWQMQGYREIEAIVLLSFPPIVYMTS